MTYKAYYYLKPSGRAPLAEYLDRLKSRDREAVSEIFSAIDMLIDQKCQLPPPYLKHVWKKIYELRVEHRRNQYRVFYFIYTQGKIVLLTGYTKKTQKIPNAILKQVQKYYFDYLTFQNEEAYQKEEISQGSPYYFS